MLVDLSSLMILFAGTPLDSKNLSMARASVIASSMPCPPDTTITAFGFSLKYSMLFSSLYCSGKETASPLSPVPSTITASSL
ncbi:hypothetical protein D3C75_1162880 [compost metagenome]